MTDSPAKAMTSFRGTPLPTIVVSPRGGSFLAEMRELWWYRELLAFLAWRDVRVRYRQTMLGLSWALIEPLVNVVLFTLIFNRLAGIESGSTPYPVYCGAAVLGWTFFSRALRATTNSLVANVGLVTKAYFPRLVLPLAAEIATLVDLVCAAAMFIVLCLFFGVVPGWHVLALPLWVGLAAMIALGTGLVFAAINVRYRDISQAVPFLTQMWMFATPVAYPIDAVPEQWLWLYLLNPMVGVVEGFRAALLPGQTLNFQLALPSLVLGMLVLALGVFWFRRAQRRFADIV